MASKNQKKFANGSSSIMSGVNGGKAQVSGDENMMKKGPWPPQEDVLLRKFVKTDGEKNWDNVHKRGLMRCGKSCRLRWTNHLRPDLKKGFFFSPKEEKIVIQMHRKVGNSWSKIAAKLRGRTDNEVKNFWNTKIKKRMISNSFETIEENFSSPTQQSEVLNETSSLSPPMNSRTPLFSPQNSQMNLNSSNSSIIPQPTFSFIDSNHNPSLEPRINILTDSTMHEDDPMISFSKNSTNQINFMADKWAQNNPSMFNDFNNPSLNNPNVNPFPRTHVLEFATGSTYYNPNPFPSIETQMGSTECSIMFPPIPTMGSMMQTTTSANKYQNSFGYVLSDEVWNDSLPFEPKIKVEVQEQGHNLESAEMTSIWVGAENDEVSFLDDSNYYYDGLTTFEGSLKMEVFAKLREYINSDTLYALVDTLKKESLEDEMESMDEELSGLLNNFNFDESPPELYLKTEGENLVSSCKTHYYLDQKVAFPSFSNANATTTNSGSDSPRSNSSKLDECFNVEDWIVTPESS